MPELVENPSAAKSGIAGLNQYLIVSAHELQRPRFTLGTGYAMWLYSVRH